MTEKIENIKVENALTLRDYFAGQALAGIMVNVEHDFGENPRERISRICYHIADEMLKQRNLK